MLPNTTILFLPYTGGQEYPQDLLIFRRELAAIETRSGKPFTAAPEYRRSRSATSCYYTKF